MNPASLVDSSQDLTRLETGNETSFNEPFDLPSTIEEATQMYRREAERRNLNFTLDLMTCPTTIVGDAKKIRTVVQNMTANARELYALSSSLPNLTTRLAQSSTRLRVELLSDAQKWTNRKALGIQARWLWRLMWWTVGEELRHRFLTPFSANSNRWNPMNRRSHLERVSVR